MSEYRIASRYAKSLLDLAVDQGKLEEVNNDMVMFTRVIEENRDLLLMLKSPVIISDKKLAILNEVFEGKVNPLTISIFQILTRKHREGYLPQIATEFHHQYNFSLGIAEASVTTTFPLTAKMRTEFSKVVEQISHKKVELTEIVDDSLIGGYILKVGDRQIDDSVSSKLQALRVEFEKNEYEKAY